MEHDKIKKMNADQKRIIAGTNHPRTVDAAPKLGDVVVLVAVIIVVVYFFVDLAIGAFISGHFQR